MEVRDYNGEGRWSKDEILNRYLQYSAEIGTTSPLDLSPQVHTEGDVTWIYPVMDKVIEGIEQGDDACKKIGIEFIEEDAKFPFGFSIRYRTARALRRSELTEPEKERIRRRFVQLLIRGDFNRVYKEYARLLKKIGVGNWWNELESGIDRSNLYVMRYYNYLKSGI